MRSRKLFEPMPEAAEEGADPPQFADEVHTAQRALYDKEAAALIEESMRALPEKQRLVFAMKHIDKMKLDEIARILGCRTGTVKAHLFRATQALRQRLGFYIRQA